MRSSFLYVILSKDNVHIICSRVPDTDNADNVIIDFVKCDMLIDNQIPHIRIAVNLSAQLCAELWILL